LFQEKVSNGSFHVVTHFLRTADIKGSSIVQPLKKVGRMLTDTVLDIYFFPLITGESKVERMQDPVFLPLLQFSLVKKIGNEMLVAVEKPVSSPCTYGFPLAQKGAEWCDACSGSDHDQVLTIVGKT